MIRRYRWPDAAKYHDALMDVCRIQRQRYPKTKLAVGGTWSSPKVLQWDTRLAPLFAWLASVDPRMEILTKADLAVWAQCMTKDDVLRPHTHSTAGMGVVNRYAGVYYLHMPKGSGCIYFPDEPEFRELHDPMMQTPKWAVPCKAGDALVFEASDRHGVTRHLTEEERYSIAWSVV